VWAEGLPFEQFPELSAANVCRHLFTRRIPGIDVSHDKAEALSRLDAAHAEIRAAHGLDTQPLITAEQIHGADIMVVDPVTVNRHFDGCDGLITRHSGIVLGIHVADCCAVFIVDPKTPAIGLVHSGRRGTERNIAGNAIRQMADRFDSEPANLIVQLSPCIRPPHYEIDFASDIVEQCRSAGAQYVHDTGVCTACQPELYYSYRAEKGKTGRMLALLALK
jgi:copper oxidase (laccase) domain-containing protein